MTFPFLFVNIAFKIRFRELTLFAAALTLGLASKMKSLWDWALTSMMDWRYFSSSLLRFPFTPTMGWLQRVTVAWLSGWIHDKTYRGSAAQYYHRQSHKPAAQERMVTFMLRSGHSQVSCPLLGRPLPSSALRLVCWQALPELMGRCHTSHSDHLFLLSSSFHWVYPSKKHKNNQCYKLPLTFS